MRLVYPAIFTPCLENEGYVVVIPDLPGCVTQGDSLIEAIDMGIDVASGWILGELEEGNDFPKPSSYDEISSEDGSFIQLLVLDMGAYAEKYGKKAIRRNVTIPAWLNTYGEKHNVNFSKVLQDALLKMAQR